MIKQTLGKEKQVFIKRETRVTKGRQIAPKILKGDR